MIIAKIYGGLGNQMFQYAAAYALAKRSNTSLKLDIRALEQPDDHNRIYCLKHFTISAPIATEEEIQNFLQTKTRFLKEAKYLQNKLGISWKKTYWHQQYIYQEQFDPCFLKGTKKDVYLEGYWQNETLFQEFKNDLSKEFSLRFPSDRQNQDWLHKIKATNSVAVHIRRGDALRATALTLYKLPEITYYQSAIQYLSQNNKHLELFIFSDDIPWCRENIESELPLHYMDFNEDAQNFEDMHLMQNCRHIITANSTFSWWGAWLNTNPNPTIITPAAWFNISKWNNSKLVPQNWIKL